MGIQSQTLTPNDYYDVPLSCFSGYIRNNNATECQILILGNGNSTYNETIPPYSVLHTTNAEYNRIYNEGAVDLILVYVDNPKTTLTFQNSSINIQSAGTTLDIGTVDTINNITSLPDITLASGQTIGLTAGTSIDIGNITGTISDITLAANQSINIGTIPDITIANSSLTINGSVDIGTMPDVTFTNTSIDIGTMPNVVISGTTDINISSISTGITFDIGTIPDITIGTWNAGAINIGSVDSITNTVATNANITNTSLTVNGSVDVGTVSTIDSITNIVEIQAGAIKTTGNTNNGLTATLATANTAQQFTTTSTAVQHFQLRNTSSENISIGNSTVQATLLFPNSMFIWDAILTETTDVSTWYFVGATAGDSISVNYQV